MVKKNGGPQNILLVKNRAMGDALMGLSTLDYLKDLYPQSSIYYAIPAWIAPLFEKAEGNFSAIFPLELHHFWGWTKLFWFLLTKKVDLIYEMHQSGRTGRFFRFFSFFFRVPYYYHNHHLKKGMSLVVDQGVVKPLIQRDLDGVYTHLSDQTNYPHYLNYPPQFCLKKPSVSQKKKKMVIFGVVATRETKRWDPKNFIQLAEKIYLRDPEYQILVPFSFSDDDEILKNEFLMQNLPSNMELVQFPLAALPPILEPAQFYIGNDTGLKHLCLSLGVKTYTFFGPEPPLEWHPYHLQEHPYFFLDGLECRTAVHHYCGLSHCPSMVCLKELTPHLVMRSLEEIFFKE